jgi:hypothetical protein
VAEYVKFGALLGGGIKGKKKEEGHGINTLVDRNSQVNKSREIEEKKI